MTGSEMRSRAMMINFGVLYGTSPKKIIASRRSGMSSDIHLATALALWQSMSRPRPDFPGGSRLFCHLLKTWTRDMTGPLGLRHEFVQNGPHIACVRCKTSVASFCGDGYDRDEKNGFRRARRPRAGISIQGLAPHKLKKAMRKVVQMMGPCELVVVRRVMEC